MDYMSGYVTAGNGYEYPLIHGENYYCVPACIKIVLSSLGYYHSVKELSSHFTIVTSSKTTADHELGIHVKNGDLDKLFNKLNVPLYEEYIPINQVPEFKFMEFIQELLQQKAHIICGYSFGMLFNENSSFDVGHASIIISSTSKYINILNPGPKFAGINMVNEYDLYCAIRHKQDGLWIFRTKN